MSLLGTDNQTANAAPVNNQTSTEPTGTPQDNWEQRYKNLQSYHDKMKNGYERQISEHSKNSNVFVAPKTPEELAEFKARNPEQYGTMETVAHMMMSEQLVPMQEQLRESQRTASLARIKEAHPDYLSIVGTEDFTAWAEATGLQDWLNEEIDANKPIKLISFYKNHLATQQGNLTEAPQQPQQPTVDPAAQVVNVNDGSPVPTGTEGIKIWTRQEIDSMSAAEYERNQDSIMAALNAGLIN